MTFEWKNRYVPEGQLEPDYYGRWALDCYIFALIDKSLPNYHFVKEMTNDPYMPVVIATMCQKGCSPDNVPSAIHKFCVSCPTFDDAGNYGLSQRNFFSNDIEDLKRIVEQQFEQIRNVFMYCR